MDRSLLVRLTLALLLAAALAGCASSASTRRSGTPAPQQVSFVAGAPSGAALPDSAVAAMHLDRERARRLGAFRGRSGEARGLWVAPTDDGRTCVLDVGTDQVGAGCGRTLFNGHELAFTEASEGGPLPEPTTLVRISGLTTAGVGSVDVALSDGSTATLEPNESRAFVYEEPAEQLAAGAVPVALVARDSSAKQVDRIDLPRPGVPGAGS
jgi:hypothetical protein